MTAKRVSEMTGDEIRARAKHTVIAGRGTAARMRAAAQRLSSRIHAAADARARALGWQVISTPGRLGAPQEAPSWLRSVMFHDEDTPMNRFSGDAHWDFHGEGAVIFREEQ